MDVTKLLPRDNGNALLLFDTLLASEGVAQIPGGVTTSVGFTSPVITVRVAGLLAGGEEAVGKAAEITKAAIADALGTRDVRLEFFNFRAQERGRADMDISLFLPDYNAEGMISALARNASAIRGAIANSGLQRPSPGPDRAR